jgi:hypothetical protein
MSGFQQLQNIFPTKSSKVYFEISLSKHRDMILSLPIIKIFQPFKGLARFDDWP